MIEKDRALNLLQNGLLPQVHGAYYEALKMAIDNWKPELKCIAKITMTDNQVNEAFGKAKCEILTEIEKFTSLQRELKEQTLAEIITKYDFIVGSEECKFKLMEILPEGANILCTSYIDNSTTIFAIKKFDVMDLLNEPQKSEDKKKINPYEKCKTCGQNQESCCGCPEVLKLERLQTFRSVGIGTNDKE